jgi:diguanylate cyclase (GGDEF)-like protein
MAGLTTDRSDSKQSVFDVLYGRALSRYLPFAVLVVASEASLLLPPGPASDGDAYISLALLGVTTVLFLLIPRVLPRRIELAVPLCYLVSVLMLIFAAGGSSAGIGLVVLLPILWAALYLEFWESVATVVAVVVVELITTYSPVDLSATIRFRRELSFLFVGLLIIVSIHELRQRDRRSRTLRDSHEASQRATIHQLNEQTRLSAVINDLVDMLSFCDVVEEAYEVFEYAARQIFVDGGAIQILNVENGELESKCRWPGPEVTVPSFSTKLCFAFEDEQPYLSDDAHARCAHFRAVETPSTYCYPLMINREIVGLLIALVPVSSGKSRADVAEDVRGHARLIGDQISIWLSNFRLRQTLKNLSIRDPLTNLFNRRFMVETLNREMAITTRSHEQTSVLQIDIDHFKVFNDSFGHEVGDVVLRAVADVMFGLFRESDVPCRSGGEEFTLILPRCSWAVAHVRALELQNRVAAMTIVVPENQPRPPAPTLSIGIATSPEHGLTSEELLRGADRAMYVAKKGGRNRIMSATAAEHV